MTLTAACVADVQPQESFREDMGRFVQQRLERLSQTDSDELKTYDRIFTELKERLDESGKKLLLKLDSLLVDIRMQEQERYFRAGLADGIKFMQTLSGGVR